ncbi:hypothetical protein D3C85_1178100 [compost metagenome]
MRDGQPDNGRDAHGLGTCPATRPRRYRREAEAHPQQDQYQRQGRRANGASKDCRPGNARAVLHRGAVSQQSFGICDHCCRAPVLDSRCSSKRVHALCQSFGIEKTSDAQWVICASKRQHHAKCMIAQASDGFYALRNQTCAPASRRNMSNQSQTFFHSDFHLPVRYFLFSSVIFHRLYTSDTHSPG